LKQMLKLRSDLQACLTVLSALLVAQVVVADALRRLINAAYAEALAPADPAQLLTVEDVRLVPQEVIILYGLYLTLLVLLVYAPIHLLLAAAGQGLAERVNPVPQPSATTAEGWDEIWEQWRARRTSLEELLELKASPLAPLQTTLAVLAPLVGGVIGAGIPFA
jgi:hypothetical protein